MPDGNGLKLAKHKIFMLFSQERLLYTVRAWQRPVIYSRDNHALPYLRK